MTSEELGEELRRLSEIAIPELLAIPWFEKVGQPSGLPKHFGRWEPDSGKAFKSQEMRFKDLTFVLRDLSSHIGTWHPASAWTLERAPAGTVIYADPFGDICDAFRKQSHGVHRRIRSLGSQHGWWSDAVDHRAYWDAAYYAIWVAFYESENIGLRKRYPDFFPRAMEICRGGHIPIGWSADPDGPPAELGQGNFIYQ